MNKVVKGFVAIAMLGILQIGLVMPTLEASPRDRHDRPPHRDDHRDHHRDKDRYHKEMQREKDRHEREMRRRPGEPHHYWEKRRHEEERRHKKEVDRIAAILIGIAIGKSL